LEKAQTAASELTALLKGAGQVSGVENEEAASKADIVILTVPYAAHADTLNHLKDRLHGKILIDVTVPLKPPKVTKVQMPPAGSAAQEALSILGADAQVASAFQNISYEHLLRDEEVTCDVLVCGSSKLARSVTLELVKSAGLVGWDAGPIENSVVVEGLTSILIGLNKQFGIQSAGIKITGISR
jgi:NADPH-dependent F420 reductase